MIARVQWKMQRVENWFFWFKNARQLYWQNSMYIIITCICYNDISTGMTDWIKPSANLDAQRAAVMQSRQVLGSIVAMGLLAGAMMESDDDCVIRHDFWGDRYLDCDDDYW